MASELKQLNLNVLVGWGLPISDVNISAGLGPSTIDSLRSEISKALKIDFNQIAESRERSAILGFLWALADHYPSLFPEIDRNWLKSFDAHNLVKLRRLSLQAFSNRIRAGIDEAG